MLKKPKERPLDSINKSGRDQDFLEGIVLTLILEGFLGNNHVWNGELHTENV